MPDSTLHVPGGGAPRSTPAPPDAEKDVAIAMVGEEVHVIDPAIAARAVRKIDWFLMPAMLVGVSGPDQWTALPTNAKLKRNLL